MSLSPCASFTSLNGRPSPFAVSLGRWRAELRALLATRGIKSKFHEVLIELCGGEEEYLADITGSFVSEP